MNALPTNDADHHPSARRVSRAQQARAARQSRQRGVPFTLKYTGIEALVTRPSIMYLADANLIPSHLRQMVDKLITQGASGTEDDGNAMSAFFEDGGLAGSRKFMDLVNTTCIAGFVDPEIVATGAELTDPDTQMTIDEIDSNDRLDFWGWCQDMDGAEAGAVSRFPVEPAHAPAAAQDGPDATKAVQLVSGYE